MNKEKLKRIKEKLEKSETYTLVAYLVNILEAILED